MVRSVLGVQLFSKATTKMRHKRMPLFLFFLSICIIYICVCVCAFVILAKVNKGKPFLLNGSSVEKFLMKMDGFTLEILDYGYMEVV